jgi:hypothetical protein
MYELPLVVCFLFLPVSFLLTDNNKKYYDLIDMFSKLSKLKYNLY